MTITTRERVAGDEDDLRMRLHNEERKTVHVQLNCFTHAGCYVFVWQSTRSRNISSTGTRGDICLYHSSYPLMMQCATEMVVGLHTLIKSAITRVEYIRVVSSMENSRVEQIVHRILRKSDS